MITLRNVHPSPATTGQAERPALYTTRNLRGGIPGNGTRTATSSTRGMPWAGWTVRNTSFPPHAGSGTCRAPTCEHATLCSHPMRRQTRQRAVVGKPGRRTARPKFGNTELSAQPTVASNGGQQDRRFLGAPQAGRIRRNPLNTNSRLMTLAAFTVEPVRGLNRKTKEMHDEPQNHPPRRC